MSALNLSPSGVLNTLKASGISDVSIKKLSDLYGKTFEFTYKHGIIAGVISSIYLTNSKDDFNNSNPKLEISLDMKQHTNFVCLEYIVRPTLEIDLDKIRWNLISNLSGTNKPYPGKLKIFYS